MKKILLINPRQGWRPPLGLLYVASCLREAGHRVKVVEFTDEEYFPGANRSRWRDVARDEPDVVGLGIISWNRKAAKDIIRDLRKLWPEKVIVCGGKDPTFKPGVYLQEGLADFVVLHEGEETMPELVRALDAGEDARRLPGLAFRENGEVRVNPGRKPLALDKIPYPALDLVDYDHDIDIRLGGIPGHFVRTGFLMASRGCPYQCRFCTDPVRAVYRERSVDDIVAEIKWQMDHWRIDGLCLMDDLFYFRESRVREFCERILRERIKLKLYAQARADILDADKGTLALMKKAGFIQLGLGVESGSQRMLDIMNKKITLAQARNAVLKIRAAGMIAYVFYIVGFPEETEEDLALTEAYLKENRPTFVTVNYFAALPGTDYFRDKEDRDLEERSYSLSEAPREFSSRVPRETIMKYRRRFLALARKSANLHLLTYPSFWLWIAGVPFLKLPLLWRSVKIQRRSLKYASYFDAMRTALINDRIYGKGTDDPNRRFFRDQRNAIGKFGTDYRPGGKSGF